MTDQLPDPLVPPEVDRRNVSKRTRFEIFKRDGFACQYCGAHPPSVLLHVDHILAPRRRDGGPLAVPLPACPPCTGNCHQSDWCDAEPESDSLAIFDALRNAVILTLAGVGAGSLVALLWLAVGR